MITEALRDEGLAKMASISKLPPFIEAPSSLRKVVARREREVSANVRWKARGKHKTKTYSFAGKVSIVPPVPEVPMLPKKLEDDKLSR